MPFFRETGHRMLLPLAVQEVRPRVERLRRNKVCFAPKSHWSCATKKGGMQCQADTA